MTAPTSRTPAVAGGSAGGDPGDGDPRGLDTAVRRLLAHVSHWTPARWSMAPRADRPAVAAEPAGGVATRAELLHTLVQRVADLAAEAEGEPRRVVPRLDNDLALRDQLLVVVADLVAARPSHALVAEATALVRQVHRAL